MKAEILPLDAQHYEAHTLHRGERAWLETNCYVDLWIEVLHAFGFDPTAALAFTVALDFEGDQWLFFKPPTGDLFELFGVDVQELNIWRNFLGHALEQVSRGRVVMVEVDAFYLPDTAGVSYRSAHTKTTIGIQCVDTEARTLGYFHNAGYFSLAGDDFAALFGLDRERRSDELVPYTEFAKFAPRERLADGELLVRSLRLLRRHLSNRPKDNPFARFRTQFLEDVVWLTNEPPETFHLYAFSTVRQCGACFELAASYVRWLSGLGERGLDAAATAFDTIASQAKTLQFKAARAVLLKRPVDFSPMFATMEQAWSSGMALLEDKYPLVPEGP